jgi:N-acyl homoserine lactone hydrolase
VWGWNNAVEPGTFTPDHAMNRKALLMLKALVQRHPSVNVRLGHQHLPAAAHAP